ncbi:MAG: hypothetical protein DRQ24_06085 [Candidatus Latescibacterota bacterium]|nr:MAG: hypothetical protein DRQ24_06085 [Candidatus Latescibacterota bacterium]
MRVNSSGLGKTTMFAKITLVDVEKESGTVRMCIEAVEPVHWYITIRMGPTDLWHLVKALFGSPLTLLKMPYLLLKGVFGPEDLKPEVPPEVPPIVKADELRAAKKAEPKRLQAREGAEHGEA